MPPGSFVLRLCSTLTFVPYFSLDPAMYYSHYQTRAITSSLCNLQTQLATQKTDVIKSTQNTTRQRLGIAALSLGRCRLALAGYVADK